jgi:hypothetical protein
MGGNDRGASHFFTDSVIASVRAASPTGEAKQSQGIELKTSPCDCFVVPPLYETLRERNDRFIFISSKNKNWDAP